MFLVNRRLGLVTAAASRSRRSDVHATGAPLLPKLRGQFAEFLDDGSLVHLGMLYQPTCVGLRYGHHPTSLEPFLASPASIRPVWPAGRPFHSPLGHSPGGFASRNSLPAWRVLQPPDLAPWIAHHSTGWRWGRNLNRLSITYAFPPRLRPASPAADQHGCGTLGHSVGGIRTPLALLMPTFALPAAPPLLPERLHR